MTSTPSPAPPRLAERVLMSLASGTIWSDDLCGDLREEHAAIAERRGRLVAGTWYWWQVVVLLVARLRDLAASGWIACRRFLSLGDRPMSNFSRELARAGRTLARQPLVAATIVLTLGLGLGVNASTFQLVTALVLNPLAGVRTDGLVMLSERTPGEYATREMVASGNFYEWRRDAHTLSRLALFDWWEVNLAGSEEPERVLGFRVTGDFFPMFGITPAAGRFIETADEAPGAGHVVVISDPLWRRRFGARSDIVGKTLRLDGEMYTVVGIAPPGFTFPLGGELWAPYPRTTAAEADHTGRLLTAIGQLAPGVTIARAADELQSIYTRQRASYPHDDDHLELSVRTLVEGMRDTGTPAVLALIQIASILVLVIGGTNIANLLIARAWDRQRETAVRLAIGASRSHGLRQFVIESLVLGLAALPVALALASAALDAIRAAMPARIERFVPGWTQIRVDWRLAVVTLGAALGAALVCSLLPAWQASKPALVQALGHGSRTAAGGSRRQRLRRALVVAQLALALPLLVAAGLATLAARTLATGPQGYDPKGVAILSTQLPDASYATAAARRTFAERLLERVRAIPGVSAAGSVNHLPSSSSSSSRQVLVAGLTLAPREPAPEVVYRIASPGYLTALKIPIVRGRDFTTRDREGAPPVAVVSAAMARRFWPDTDPIGQRIRLTGDDEPSITVIGVAGNIIDDWFDRRNAAMLYVASAQNPNAHVELAVRATGDPARLTSDLRRALRDVDPYQPAEILPMSTLVADRTVGLRLVGAMMGVLGLLALVLAAIGIYSLMAYFVSQRRREIGVRLALGASRASVIRLTVGSAAKLAATGLAIGLAIALATARVMEGALFGAASAGPSLFATIAVLLAVIALVASLVPARQAASIDPARTLHAE